MKDNMEDRQKRFKRIAEKRTNEIIRRIQLLGNCSNKSSYDYSEQEVNKIINAISTVISLHYATFLSTPLCLRNFCFC